LFCKLRFSIVSSVAELTISDEDDHYRVFTIAVSCRRLENLIGGSFECQVWVGFRETTVTSSVLNVPDDPCWVGIVIKLQVDGGSAFK
jgi:hypothetical protein